MLINQFIILSSRRHYTDDVFLAWFVVLTVFFMRTNNPRKVMGLLFNQIKNFDPQKIMTRDKKSNRNNLFFIIKSLTTFGRT